MRYIFAVLPFAGIIALHDAWQSIECPLLLAAAGLVCIIIKINKHEQNKKESTK